jgi:signal transduction histidine kinase
MRIRANARTVARMAHPEPAIVQLARVPGRIPRVDLAIAAGLLVWAVLEALFADGPGSTATRVLLAVGFTVPMAFRRRWPITALLLVALLAVIRGATGGVDEVGAMPVPTLLLGSFSAALYARPRRLAYLAAPVPIVVAPLAGFGEIEVLPVFFLAGTAWGAGFLIRRRAEQLARARARGPELAREAVAAERARMARELHDLVAHSVTVVSVQAGAAEGVMRSEPGKARAHLEAVHRAAHEALVELRRLVGVLREDEASYSPQPGLERLDQLVEEARGAGLPVELIADGRRERVPAGLDLTAYRIVQESLTNVRRHAGNAPTRVRIRHGEERLELEIANAPGPGDGVLGAGGGQGLIGMRERVRLYGGTFEAGAAPDGGYVVRAGLPLDAPPLESVDAAPAADAAARPERGISRTDVAVTGGFLVLALLDTLLSGGPAAPGERVLFAIASTLPLLGRRRWPVQALAVVCAVMILRGAAFDGLGEESVHFAAAVVLTFSAAVHARSRRWAMAAAPLPVIAIVVGVLTEDLDSPPAVDIAILSALAIGAWIAGWVVRRRAEQLAHARAQAPELARAAVAAERARVAAELHDVVAHSISIVSVQAGAAEQLLEKDPPAAREHLRAVQQAAQEALREMRRLLGVLREDGADYAPQPGLARLPDLLDDARRAGFAVELREEGERGEVAQGVDLAAFRIVQEALTNVRKHAGRAATTVGIRYGADEIELDVENGPGAGADGGGSGYGIPGMRERARVYGGSVEAGPDGRGGFAVRARLPR